MKMLKGKGGFIQFAVASVPMVIAVVIAIFLLGGSSLIFLFTNKWLLYLILAVIALKFLRG